MLDIISMITLLFLLIGLSLILIIIGASNRTEEEQNREDEDQIKYLKKYKGNQLRRRLYRRIKTFFKITY